MFDLLRDPFFSGFFDEIENVSKMQRANQWKDVGEKYALRINVPGYTEEDININVLPVDNLYNKITISGKVNRQDEIGHSSGSFEMTEYLFNINPEKITATLKNGQLTIVAEKKDTKPALPEGKEVKVLTELTNK